MRMQQNKRNMRCQLLLNTRNSVLDGKPMHVERQTEYTFQFGSLPKQFGAEGKPCAYSQKHGMQSHIIRYTSW